MEYLWKVDADITLSFSWKWISWQLLCMSVYFSHPSACSPCRSKWGGWSCHVAGQWLASSYPPARDGSPGWGPLHRPHGQQDLHQHQLAGTQWIADPQDRPQTLTQESVKLMICDDLSVAFIGLQCVDESFYIRCFEHIRILSCEKCESDTFWSLVLVGIRAQYQDHRELLQLKIHHSAEVFLWLLEAAGQKPQSNDLAV